MLQFNLFRFRITVQPSFWITSVLLGLGLAAGSQGHIMLLILWVLISLLSILWHELGHAFAFRRFGIESEIVLYAFGGLAIPITRRSLTRGQDMVVSAAGPVVQLLIGVPLWWMDREGMFGAFVEDRPFAWAVIWMFMYINLFWALVNLLPVLPLDGGHISSAVCGPRRQRIALWISLTFAVAMIVFCLTREKAMVFSGVFFGMLAWNNWQRLKGGPEVPWMNGQ